MKCNSEISCKVLPWVVFIAEGHISMLAALSYKGLDTDTMLQYAVGFPGGSVSGKESACQCRRHGFNHWVWKIPWKREWLPTPVFLPGESHGQRSLMGYSPWGPKESA